MTSIPSLKFLALANLQVWATSKKSPSPLSGVQKFEKAQV